MIAKGALSGIGGVKNGGGGSQASQVKKQKEQEKMSDEEIASQARKNKLNDVFNKI